MNFKYVPKKVGENEEKMKIIEDQAYNSQKSKLIIDKGSEIGRVKKRDLTLKSP